MIRNWAVTTARDVNALVESTADPKTILRVLELAGATDTTVRTVVREYQRQEQAYWNHAA